MEKKELLWITTGFVYTNDREMYDVYDMALFATD